MKPVYLDETKTDAERVSDLVEQMTLEEKCSQLRYDAPAIPRLGIPNYNWWNEALHGVARAGAATVFPQSIGLAAMFDEEFLQKIGDIVATEGRAKYHEAAANGDRGLYKGITFWSPNINIFRDPRWGRGHETYGEDPCLTGRMGTAYIKGIQGNGKRLKAAACVKHFAAHSGPEKGRHSFNSIVSKKDLNETYYPAFEKCVKDAKVEGIMGGYNRLNGEAACGSYSMITELLREKWGFDGYYVSDCGAIKDFHMFHGLTATAAESGALALKSGCDLNCGAVYLHLMNAYVQGLISEEDINKAVYHVMMTRMRLGMFDEHNEYENIPYEINDCKEHHDQALIAAEKSMILLKNNGMLPLKKEEIKTVAVIGPNADSDEILKGNYNGTATEKYTLLEGIRNAIGDSARIYYSEGAHLYRENVESLAEADDRIKEAVTIAKRSDVVILCLGLNGTLEGEEGDANNSYAGADKADLNLPESQMRLLKAVCETGKQVVLLLATGSAMAINHAAEHCDAILQVWYPGQMGGIAAANLLFGKTSPSGKLPVTFYRTTEELPDFTDYSMKNRTYRYMEQEALYPFGYGLSYGDFTYDGLGVDQVVPGTDGYVRISVSVRNNSAVECEEVTQVYIKITNSLFAVPNYTLTDFKRVHLQSGEKKQIEFLLPASVFMVINDEGERILDGDKAFIYVGGSQPDARSIKLTGKTPLNSVIEIGGLK
ncbi:glycoside hydrolase family 3 C-terminal domain-containing protein [Anaerocolumna sp. MB42-C2]|uniref:glycoside hydrolase family 3 C-terminal domain-containing protein n=1 Tax=Anaerocolumna sp. MB42-C2 TaxID=3070997 RepID=UPI0027E0FC13|nr:glycoside hydrolase family 3 C-terminal domain-containing protein [Anaerocolumna sp. MB42-C2]WMJ87467.1 glycoside hydrolase family 3 C-terminal domain-containing protein [Anaerocolumna sp. MB42-C2]